jgi:hypothetical protein
MRRHHVILLQFGCHESRPSAAVKLIARATLPACSS